MGERQGTTMLLSRRGRLWFEALRADLLQQEAAPDLYESLAAKASTLSTPELTVIEKDIGRTFPERQEFQSDQSRERLRRVLSAYAVRHTYCQGMSYVAALMLQHMPEQEAFWALASLVENFLPDGYYTDDLYGACMDQHIGFATFLPYKLPRVAAHLAKLEFPLTLIGVRWFLCLFAADFELEHTCMLWDFLFAHGAHVLFAIALALLADHEDRLLAASVPPCSRTAFLLFPATHCHKAYQRCCPALALTPTV